MAGRFRNLRPRVEPAEVLFALLAQFVGFSAQFHDAALEPLQTLKKQTLKKRIRQHWFPGDHGGELRTVSLVRVAVAVCSKLHRRTYAFCPEP